MPEAKPKLPELPKPDAYATQIKEGRALFEPRASLNVGGMVGVFSSKQALAIQREAWNAAIELAAQIAEGAPAGDGRHGIAAAIRLCCPSHY